MENIEGRLSFWQWSSDISTLLKAGLRTQDTETIQAAFARVEQRLGKAGAETFLNATITQMITEEGYQIPL